MRPLLNKLARAVTSWPVGLGLGALTWVDEVDAPHFVSPRASAAFGIYSAAALAFQPRSWLSIFAHGNNISIQGMKLYREMMPPEVVAPAEGQSRTRVVVLGSGWGAMSFIKNLSPSRTADGGLYDLTVISPRNYFLYTPLLPGAVTGTVEVKSVVEAVRSLLKGKGNYYEAACYDIDTERQVVKCRYPKPFKNVGDINPDFEVPYDVLVMGVGAVVNTFNTPGVQEHSYFLKEMEDAVALKQRVRECFELAALPECNEETKKKLLSFVVVGGGPTGVETAAEIHDLVQEDIRKVLPGLADHVSIKLIETRDHILSMYDKQISEYTEQHFNREGINLLLGKMVQKVEPEGMQVKNADGTSEFIPARTVVWCTGIKLNPLAVQLMNKLGKDVQGNARAIRTDGFLQVNGSGGSIYALGDTSTIEQEKVLQHAEMLFKKGDKNKNGLLSCSEIRDLMKEASHRYPQLSLMEKEFECTNASGFMARLQARLSWGETAEHVQDEDAVGFTFDQFKEKLEAIDKTMRSLPATAQVANQEGRYLAELFNHFNVTPSAGGLPEDAPAFTYAHTGAFAYIGADKAVMEMTLNGEKPGVFTGWLTGLAWKGLESWMQISTRNKYLVSRDWVKSKVFGRDLSDV